MLTYIFQKISYIYIWNELTINFLNYKIFIFYWLKILKEYYLSFEYMSTRKAYSINFKLLMFNEYKDSFYAWIPHSFIHTIVRFIYVVLYNKEPESWIYGLHYFSFFYRLGWDFLGLYISKGDQFNIIDHIFFGFFQDSIYHKYYLGYDYNNLLLYYNFVELKNFFIN